MCCLSLEISLIWHSDQVKVQMEQASSQSPLEIEDLLWEQCLERECHHAQTNMN